MEKLVALVAEEVKYEGLTRGWYKFGIYSPVAYSVARKYTTLELQA